MAASVLVTDSLELADAVEVELGKQVFADPPHASGSAPHSAVDSRASCWSTTWTRASTWSTPTPPSTSRSTPGTRAAHAARIRNAGAIFVGPWAPVSLGDYCAGSNHVLPTAGCACHSSGLSVRAFTRSVHVIDYSRGRTRRRWPTTS